MRKLVTVRKILDIIPIPGADAIELARIDGWQVVVKRGEFSQGDKCVYFEIDSFLSDGNPAWQFLVDKQPKEFDGKKGHRLRTVKLRGALSQGLALSLEIFPEVKTALSFEKAAWAKLPIETRGPFNESDFDFSELLGVVKYDPPVPASLAGEVKGYFPSFIQKTDQERCQNLASEIFQDNAGSQYEVTLKLDGTSATFYYLDGAVGVCSRNLELKINDANKDNTYVSLFNDSGLKQSLESGQYGNIAIQGEIMGPGIQGNPENFKHAKLFIFDIFNINTGKYLTPSERYGVCDKLLNDSCVARDRVEHIQVIDPNLTLPSEGLAVVEDLLKLADGPSINAKIREGLVFKKLDGSFSFKAISNQFLLNEK